MNKKGFTLVELLTIIVVISVIAIITVSVVFDKIESSRKKAYDIQIDNIVDLTKTYMLQEEDLDPNHTNTLCIYVSDLQDKGLLKSGKVVNPNTNENIAEKINNKSKGVVIVKFDHSTNQYTYNFTTEGCTEVIVTPAYQTILSNETVKTVGNTDGLYEENNEYIYKGENPNNYITFKNSTWRIISIDKETNMLKIINLNDNQKSLSSNKVSGLVDDLNEEFSTENSSYQSVKDYINNNSKWNKGNVSALSSALSLKSQEKQSNDYKTINLLTLGEYVNASLDNNCYKTTCTSYLSTSKNYWLLNQTSDNKNWCIKSDNKADKVVPSDQLYNVYPVLYLNTGVEIDEGNGTSTTPYKLK